MMKQSCSEAPAWCSDPDSCFDLKSYGGEACAQRVWIIGEPIQALYAWMTILRSCEAPAWCSDACAKRACIIGGAMQAVCAWMTNLEPCEAPVDHWRAYTGTV